MDKVATGERITATQAQLDQPLHERPNTGTWFITGTSSGLGRALVAALLERGDNVVATARQPDAVADLAGLYPERALLVRLDVTDRAEVEAAVAQALERFGRIDVVVNNAGYGVLGPSRRRRTSKPTRSSKPISLERSMSRAVLPALRQQRAGHFLQISSIGGQIAFPGLGIYNATKFGLEAISQALAGELAPHGIIKVTIVEDGLGRAVDGLYRTA
jgi:NADP-dependent 3-hydroxy acid dehydrogenase YdfG